MNDQDLINELAASQPEEETLQEVSEEPQAEAPAEESPEEPQEEEVVEETEADVPIGELLGRKKERKDDSVPLAVHLETKNNLKTKLAELESQVQTLKQRDDSIASLADEYDVDLEFVTRLADSIASKTTKEVQAKYEPLIKEREEEKVVKMFDKVYGKALENMPEYASVVNKDIVQKLALDPSNSDKTVKQIIESIYGNVVAKAEAQPGASFEKGSTGTKVSGELDFDNLSAEDHKLIASDPKLRAAYGDHIATSINW